MLRRLITLVSFVSKQFSFHGGYKDLLAECEWIKLHSIKAHVSIPLFKARKSSEELAYFYSPKPPLDQLENRRSAG